MRVTVPDQQEGSIRFDQRDTLLAEADSGSQAIVLGDADESELIRRITSTDEFERMPPEGKPLTESEVNAIRLWIEDGAEFETHWAFQPIRNPELPKVSRKRLGQRTHRSIYPSRIGKQTKLQPAKQADKATLVRRVYLDVTGLPPTPERVAELVSSWDGQSYARLVEQLVADPGFGERWARNWLDVVRYAETNSYERDGSETECLEVS